MQLLAGTSGFSYKEWYGHFYPEKLPANEMLRYYAGHFSTVEINNTFYRMPAPSMLEQWIEQVPDGFSFTLKAPRRITHIERLKESAQSVAEFLRRASFLGTKLGVILFQLPPFLKKDLPRLSSFLELLPATDTEKGDTPMVTTSDWAYIRLRRTHYDEADLRAWSAIIAKQPVGRTHVYFMHEDEALGTGFARTLLAAWKEQPGA